MMTLLRILAVALAVSVATTGSARAQVTPVYEGFRTVNTNGQDSSYGQGLTHRYVNGELRFLTLALRGVLHEFRIADKPLGGTVNTTTATWDLNATGALNNFSGIWFEQAQNRLWVTSAEDYTTTNFPAKVTLITLGANGSATRIKQFYLNVPAKRVYGGCNAIPDALRAQLGGAYACGWGGYTSLVAQGGGASMGPTMYAIPDPASIANGAIVTARVILDAGTDNRGVRLSSPTNYFDGGDPRQNPPTRPTAPPVSTAAWLSPNSQGLGWMVWGDSYYNTGMWIGTTFVSVASLCQGSCWYQTSTLAFDGRQFEFHQWVGSGLGSNPLKRPDSMMAISVPRGNAEVWGGNTPTGNIAGATYDAPSGRLYLLGFPFGTNPYDGRLYSFTVGGVVTPPPPPVPTDAVVGEWSAWTGGAWSACVAGTQTRAETRTRAVVTPATNGGTTPALEEGRTGSQACTVPPVDPPPPPPPPVPTVSYSTVGVVTQCRLTLSADRTPDGLSGWGVQFRRNGSSHGSRDTSAPFARTATVAAGTYSLTATWTKSGQETVQASLGTWTCPD